MVVESEFAAAIVDQFGFFKSSASAGGNSLSITMGSKRSLITPHLVNACLVGVARIFAFT